MGPYEFRDQIRQFMLPGKFQSVRNMFDYSGCTFFGREAVMIVRSTRRKAVILDKTGRIVHLPDVMVEGTGPDQECIGVDGTCRSIGHVHHLEGMLEGSGSLVLKFTQKHIIGVTKFPEPRIGYQVEHLFEKIDQRIPCDYQHGSDEHEQDRMIGIVSGHSDQTEPEIGDRQGHEHYNRSNELLPPLVEEFEGEHRHHAGYSEHHEQNDSVAGKDQQWQVGDYADRKVHLVLEERLHVQGCQGKRHHVQESGCELVDEQGDRNRNQEHQDEVPEPPGILEYPLVQEIYYQEEENGDHKGNQGVSEPEKDSGAAIAHIVFVFDLVGIEHLGDFGSHDFTL